VCFGSAAGHDGFCDLRAKAVFDLLINAMSPAAVNIRDIRGRTATFYAGLSDNAVLFATMLLCPKVDPNVLLGDSGPST